MRSLILALIFLTLSSRAFSQKYIFYLHGRIIEDQGVNAISPEYGAYEYNAILDTFRKAGFKVISEVRKPNTDVREYERKTVMQISDLLKKGVDPADITVIGASKGAVIAMLVSSYLKNEKVNFVFMAGCNEGTLNGYPDINFCGNILSIHERSDDIGGNCKQFRFRTMNPMPHYREIEINTGLHHGFLFKPLPEWVKPALQWASGNYEL